MSAQTLAGLAELPYTQWVQARVLRVEKPAESQDLRGDDNHDPAADRQAQRPPQPKSSQIATAPTAPSWYVTALSAPFAAQVIGQALSEPCSPVQSLRGGYDRHVAASARSFDMRI